MISMHLGGRELNRPGVRESLWEMEENAISPRNPVTGRQSSPDTSMMLPGCISAARGVLHDISNACKRKDTRNSFIAGKRCNYGEKRTPVFLVGPVYPCLHLHCDISRIENIPGPSMDSIYIWHGFAGNHHGVVVDLHCPRRLLPEDVAGGIIWSTGTNFSVLSSST